MPTVEATRALCALAIVCLGAYFGSTIAALQLITPSEMRASNSALMLMVLTLTGLALGTALIGGLADIAFPGNPAGIGRSMALVGIPEIGRASCRERVCQYG